MGGIKDGGGCTGKLVLGFLGGEGRGRLSAGFLGRALQLLGMESIH